MARFVAQIFDASREIREERGAVNMDAADALLGGIEAIKRVVFLRKEQESSLNVENFWEMIVISLKKQRKRGRGINHETQRKVG